MASGSLASLRRQVAQLSRRVEWLEKALEEKPVDSSSRAAADFKRRMAELDARSKAIREFLEGDETPEQKARYLAYREKLNAHLRSLGFEGLGDR